MQSELVRIEHGHGNNEWSAMEEVHDPAQADTEREWSRHRIFKCKSCDEEFRVEVPEPSQGR